MSGRRLRIALSSVLFVLANRSASAQQIIWTPPQAVVQVFPGGIRFVSISFEANQSLTNLEVTAVPELVPSVTVTPSTYELVGAHEKREVTLAIKVSETIAPGTILDGTLHLRQGRRTVAKPLPITVHVISPQSAIDRLAEFLVEQFGTLTPQIPTVGDIPGQVALPDDIAEAFRAGTDEVVVLTAGSLFITSTFTPNPELMEAVGDLLVELETKGISITALRAALFQNTFHREGSDTDGVMLLDRWGLTGVTISPGPLRIQPTASGGVDFVLVTDQRTHIVLRGADSDILIARQFEFSPGVLHEGAVTALHELTHAMVFRTGCFFDPFSLFRDREEPIVRALDEVYRSSFSGEQERLRRAAERVIDEGGGGCLEHLGVSPLEIPVFDFALDALSVDGNVMGASVDGNPDFLDDFNDGSLIAFPTSEFVCFQPVSESGGFLNLRSADGANTLTPDVLVDNCQLGLRDGSPFRIREGAGNFVATASFRADTPLQGQGYGVQVFTFQANEGVNIQMSNFGGGPVISSSAFSGAGTPVTGSLPVNLSGAARIVLRVEFNDGTNLVAPSFCVVSSLSTDECANDAAFTPIPVPQLGTIMTTRSEGVVSVFGFVVTP